MLAGLILMGCGSGDDASVTLTDEDVRDVEAMESFMQSMREPPKDEEIIDTVKQAVSHAGDGTTWQWAEQQIDALKGDILFPRWKILRRGSGKYEVRYTFTLIDENEAIAMRGWAWKVDMALQLVSSPRELTVDELATGAGRRRSQYQRSNAKLKRGGEE